MKNGKQKSGTGDIKYYKDKIYRMDDKEANFIVSSLLETITKLEKILIDHVQNFSPFSLPFRHVTLILYFPNLQSPKCSHSLEFLTCKCSIHITPNYTLFYYQFP